MKQLAALLLTSTVAASPGGATPPAAAAAQNAVAEPAGKTETTRPVALHGWQKDARIVAVRKVVSTVDGLANDHALKVANGSGACGDDPARVELGRDANGVVRRLTARVGGEDSAAVVTATYDDTGALRFVLIEEGAISGGTLAIRSYFDAKGKALFQNEAPVGPGYTWWRPADAAMALLNTPDTLAAKGPCALVPEG